ncbi:MAG: hypothetical protein IPM95_06460 [Sphingobacteriales bacterium]|nr:hypothetical protein [Sphingobacteriales bacterium]
MPNKKKKPQKSSPTIGNFEQIASMALEMAANKAKLKTVQVKKSIDLRNQN